MKHVKSVTVCGWMLFSAFFLLLMLPRWCGVGMFVDGITYATIARNLAEATPMRAWDLHYTATVHPQFFEHPPLGIWLMAAPFVLLGDFPHAETLYAVFMAFAFVSASVVLWRVAAPQELGSWAYCILLFCCPLTSWVLANNMLEAPLTVFCMLALACLLYGSRAPGFKCGLWGGAAGLCTTAALLCKGPMALFLWTWPAVAFFAWPARRRAVLWSSLAAGLVCLCIVSSIMYDTMSRDYLTTYFYRQVWQSVRGAREIASWRGVALTRLITELMLPFLVVGSLAWVTTRRHEGRKEIFLEARQDSIGWAMLALAASLPVAVSPKQSGWYIFQSLPLYALALATQFQGVLSSCQEMLSRHVSQTRRVAVALGCIACVVGGCRWGRVDKYKDFHRDLSRLSEAPEHVLVQVCPQTLMANWGLHANMARSFHASLSGDAVTSWHLVDNQASCSIPLGCRIVNNEARGTRYVLYACDNI